MEKRPAGTEIAELPALRCILSVPLLNTVILMDLGSVPFQWLLL